MCTPPIPQIGQSHVRSDRVKSGPKWEEAPVVQGLQEAHLCSGAAGFKRVGVAVYFQTGAFCGGLHATINKGAVGEHE